MVPFVFCQSVGGGRASDRCITMNSGFLNLLSNGDTVLADHGFTISDDLAVFGGKLEIPEFTGGKKQLSVAEVEQSEIVKGAHTCRAHYWPP